MNREICSSRLLPGLDDDEVESPPFRFSRFEELMAAAYLNHIRHPGESSFHLADWLNQRTPYWRWARAHHVLESRRTFGCDDETILAYELLHARAHGLQPACGDQRIIDAILIHERNDRTRWILEAHLLLPEPPANLAAKLGLSDVTIRYYKAWFFDVRRWLTKPTWIESRVLGGSSWIGFADDDLGPIWRRIAYYTKCERTLDIAVAVTTDAGRERFSDVECDEVQFRIEQVRLSPVYHAKELILLHQRVEAEHFGRHPSSYYTPRRRKKDTPNDVETTGAIETLEFSLGKPLAVAARDSREPITVNAIPDQQVSR